MNVTTYDFNNTDIPLLFQYSLDYSIRMKFINKFGKGDVDMNEFIPWIEEWVNTEPQTVFKQDIKDIAQVTEIKKRIEQYKRHLKNKDTNPYS